MEQRIVFEDKNVSYKTFLEDLATFLDKESSKKVL